MFSKSAKYGIPYMGSKQEIADEIIKIFPSADNFYDLFGGGFSITHAMLSRRASSFKCLHFNEIKADIVNLIKRAISGEFNYENFKPQFVSRNDFESNLNDPYVRCVWSFANNQRNYLYSRDIEPYKKSMHNAVVFNDFDELATKVFGFNKFKDGYSIEARRLLLRNRIVCFVKNGFPDFLKCYLNSKQLEKLETQKEQYRFWQSGRFPQLRRLQQLQQLERLQQLQQLQRLEQLQRLKFYTTSYDQVPILPNSIIYCDPPYKDTGDYGNEFNHNAFLDWCDKQDSAVFISEYKIDDQRFRLINGVRKKAKFVNSKDKGVFKMEQIYLNRAGVQKYLKH